MTQDKLTALQNELEETKKYLLNKLAEIRKQTDALKAEDNGVWEPKDGDYFYTIANEGTVIPTTHGGTPSWDMVVSLSNAFRTKEEAETEAKRRAVTWKLKKAAKGFVPDWEPIDDHWCDKFHIAYDSQHSFWYVRDSQVDRFPNTVYFPSREAAQAAIDQLGDDLLALL